MELSTLRVYRETLTTCFTRARGALGDLCDALLTDLAARSLIDLAQAACFQRRWSSVYAALADEQVDRPALQRLFVDSAPRPGAGQRLVLAIDDPHAAEQWPCRQVRRGHPAGGRPHRARRGIRAIGDTHGAPGSLLVHRTSGGLTAQGSTQDAWRSPLPRATTPPTLNGRRPVRGSTPGDVEHRLPVPSLLRETSAGCPGGEEEHDDRETVA